MFQIYWSLYYKIEFQGPSGSFVFLRLKPYWRTDTHTYRFLEAHRSWKYTKKHFDQVTCKGYCHVFYSVFYHLRRNIPRWPPLIVIQVQGLWNRKFITANPRVCFAVTSIMYSKSVNMGTQKASTRYVDTFWVPMLTFFEYLFDRFVCWRFLSPHVDIFWVPFW